MPVLTFYWLRHAPPINPDGLAYGEDMEVDLSGKTRTAIRRQAKNLPCNAEWLVSPILRTVQTAEVFGQIKKESSIGQFQTIKPRHVEGLKEQFFGDWAGRPRRDLFYDAAFRTYLADPANVSPPGGESMNVFASRVSATIDTLIAEHPDGGNIVIVTHAGTIRAALAQATGREIRETLIFGVDPLSLTEIRYDPDKARNGKSAWRIPRTNNPA